MSTMQKAIVVTNQLTQPDGKVILEDRPIPEPGPGDVLVEVHAAALNPMDWMMAELGLFVTKWPVDLGADAAAKRVRETAGTTERRKRLAATGATDHDQAYQNACGRLHKFHLVAAAPALAHALHNGRPHRLTLRRIIVCSAHP